MSWRDRWNRLREVARLDPQLVGVFGILGALLGFVLVPVGYVLAASIGGLAAFVVRFPNANAEQWLGFWGGVIGGIAALAAAVAVILWERSRDSREETKAIRRTANALRSEATLAVHLLIVAEAYCREWEQFIQRGLFQMHPLTSNIGEKQNARWNDIAEILAKVANRSETWPFLDRPEWLAGLPSRQLTRATLIRAKMGAPLVENVPTFVTVTIEHDLKTVHQAIIDYIPELIDYVKSMDELAGARFEGGVNLLRGIAFRQQIAKDIIENVEEKTAADFYQWFLTRGINADIVARTKGFAALDWTAELTPTKKL